MKKLHFFVAFLLMSILFVSVSHAFIIYLRPPKIVLRTEVGSKTDAFMEIKNMNNFSIEINATPSSNISSIIELKKTHFTLQPNQTEYINITAKPTKPGYYPGNLNIIWSAAGYPSFTMDAEVIVVGLGSETKPTGNFILSNATPIAIGITFLAVIATLIIAKKKSVFMIAILLLLSTANAANVALIVKDSSSALDPTHESKIYNILVSMGNHVVLIDKNNYNTTDFSSIKLTVVAGRPLDIYPYYQLDSFVANLPVNDKPTIAIDALYPDDWGWVYPSGISNLVSSKEQKMIIYNDSHPITKGWKSGDTVTVHVVSGKSILDLISGRHNFHPLTITPTGNNVVIGYMDAGSQAYNGNITKAPSVFFGITNSKYWTDDATEFFKRSVEWLTLDSDDDGVTDSVDNCLMLANHNQTDSDRDGIGDACDICVNDALNDVDGDGICGNLDNCPRKYNPDQIDSDRDGIGDACEISGNQILADVDSDGEDEQAIDFNAIADDGYEVYNDTNSRALTIDADFDGMTDFLIDINKNGTYERYWDPDDSIVTNTVKFNNSYLLDRDGDGQVDIGYSLDGFYFWVQDIDGDGKLEKAIDSNGDGRFDVYETSGNTTVFLQRDVDGDGKPDFILIDQTGKPAYYWDPNRKIVTKIARVDADNNGSYEYVLDVNGDGIYEKVLVNSNIYDTADLKILKIVESPESPLSGQNIKLIVSIKNDGGYGASNFVLNITTNSSRVLSLTAGETADVEFDLGSLQSGTYTVEAQVDYDNRVLESNKTNNQASHTFSVSQPSLQTTTTVSAGGYVKPRTKEILYWSDVPELIEIDVGSSKNVEVKLVNDLYFDLENVGFSIEGQGFNTSWFSVNPELIDRLRAKTSQDVALTFTVPEDAEIFTYVLTLKAKGDSIYTEQEAEHELRVLLKGKTVEETTTSITTTTVPEEEGKSPLSGLITLAKASPWLVIGVLGMLIVLFVIWKWM